MDKLSLKNILCHYLPTNYYNGLPGKPISWTLNILFTKINLIMSLIWILSSFLVHGIDHQMFIIYAWIWGINGVISSLIIGFILLIPDKDEKKGNRWTAPITFLLLQSVFFNINLSWTFLCDDDDLSNIGQKIIIYASLNLLFWLLINILAHFMIAIIAIYKGRAFGDKISCYYICCIVLLSIIIVSKDTISALLNGVSILLSIIEMCSIFMINSVYLAFHPEQEAIQQARIQRELSEENKNDSNDKVKSKKKKKSSLNQSKKHLK